MAWQGIEGHDAIAAAFVTAEAQGRIAGSYLFIGPPGVGKGAFALALARALVCLDRRPGLVACNACASCLQAAAGSHPDIDVVAKPEDRASIPLEAFVGDAAHRMREGLCWRMLLEPALGGRKVAIVLDADHLGEEAANCLLKTLEEPPPGAVMILVGTGLERQLPTIRSRCRTIRFGPLSTGTVQRLVAVELARRDEEVAAAAIATAAAAAGGSLDRALLLLDAALGGFRGRLLELLSRRPLRGVELARETTAVVESAGKEAPPRRARLAVILDAAIDFYRAAIRHAATGTPPTEPALARAVATWAGDADEAATALEGTLDARDAVDRNAHLPTLVDAWTALLEAPRLAHLP
ncbi:MAG: AAA family ATPase [Planctomycetes bacterium]|nr:AAA family ATPase [Planctomycetota bacterium]